MRTALSSQLNRPLTIGNQTIDKRLSLSPMATLGHVAFRELVSEFGGYGLLFTEMCRANTIPNENRHTSAYFKWRDEELNQLVCQIFGNDPEIMAAAARRIEDEGFFGVDINFGCSTGLICRQDCGAALLKTPDRAVRIVDRIRGAISIPLFVKFRTGWKDDPHGAVDLARRLEAAGADALTFHPRVAPDRRARPPKWEYIGQVKAAVTIPVFGNGNVFSHEDCRRMLERTGCDGVAIGRMAVANPWIFASLSEGLIPGPDIHFDSAIAMAKLLAKHFDPRRALGRFKKFALYFSANFRYGHTFYTNIRNAKEMAEVENILCKFFETPPELGTTPNMNFFV